MPKSIPFELVALEPNSFHILVDATLSGEPVKLIVDSGASRTILHRCYSPEQGAEGAPDTVAVGFMSDNVKIQLASIPELHVGGLIFSNFPVALADLSALRKLYSGITGLNVAGLLGCDFLAHNVSSVNLRLKKIFILDQPKNP